MNRILHRHWAQPVVRQRYAYLADILFAVSKVIRYRGLNHVKHCAWERATGASRQCIWLPGVHRTATTITTRVAHRGKTV
jgi:hypothetical protein